MMHEECIRIRTSVETTSGAATGAQSEKQKITSKHANEFRIIADDFKENWNLPNCVRAVDGHHFSMETLPNSETFFFNYKKFTSVVLIAACDAVLRFMWLNVGSLNNALIFNESDLGNGLEIQNINLPSDERLPLPNISVPFISLKTEALL
ncbi:hypothetical protein TSAR_002103 [Trichomalopsis sarcophagae]|uniref:DDE Tnp4 domain-containing protein n=1 Tax=Trichomalopsis sarcophagae TaxID=543379 RepID=A0A232EPJ5_9HYME|nr:hypothetical protein TSAR_002103 [Trichomalopsis sarcophagae]